MKHLRNLGALVALVSLLSGCPASQTWTTARTLDEGDVQYSAGAEFLGFQAEYSDPSASSELNGILLVPFPAFVLRYGVAEHVEIGGKFSMTGSMTFDVKIQLLRTDAFDLAFDPGLTSAFLINYLHLPILASLNFGENVTLTFAPKVSYAFIVASDGSSTDSADGFFVGGALSLQFRIGESFAITPAFEWLEAVDPGAYTRFAILNFALGFSFGGRPVYGEAGYGSAQPAPMAPAPAGPTGPGYESAPPGY